MDENERGLSDLTFLIQGAHDEGSNLFRRICRPGRRDGACGMQ
jgi:hypothetical protein